jgi:hypothetical protein
MYMEVEIYDQCFLSYENLLHPFPWPYIEVLYLYPFLPSQRVATTEGDNNRPERCWLLHFFSLGSLQRKPVHPPTKSTAR